MSLFQSIKKFFSRASDVASIAIDQKTEELEKTRIVELATKDVRAMRDKVSDGITKCAELRLTIKKLADERNAAQKRLEKVSADYASQIAKTKEMIAAGSDEEAVKLEKIEANALLKIKKSVESTLETLVLTIASLEANQKDLLTNLKIMHSNISVMECELQKQKAKKSYIELHNQVVKSIAGTVDGGDSTYLNRLGDENTVGEGVIELKEEVLGTPSLRAQNADIDAQVESDLAN